MSRRGDPPPKEMPEEFAPYTLDGDKQLFGHISIAADVAMTEGKPFLWWNGRLIAITGNKESYQLWDVEEVNDGTLSQTHS